MAKFRLELDPTPIVKGSAQAKDALNKVGKQAQVTEKQVVASATKSGNAFTRLGQRMDGRTRFIFNNTANQLGDVAVQASMRTDMFRVMGMQLPQLAGGFALLGGSLGIVMPLLGVLAAIGFPIIAAFRAMSGASKGFSEKIDELNESITDLSSTHRLAYLPIDKLTEGFGRASEMVRQVNRDLFELNDLLVVKNMNKRFEEFATIYGDISNFSASVARLGEMGLPRGATPEERARGFLGTEDIGIARTALRQVEEGLGLSRDQAIEFLKAMEEVNAAITDQEKFEALAKVTAFNKQIATEQINSGKELNDQMTIQIENTEILFKVFEKYAKLREKTTKALRININANDPFSGYPKGGGRGEVMPSAGDLALMRMGGVDTESMKRHDRLVAKRKKELNDLLRYAQAIKPILTLTQEYEFAQNTLNVAKEKGVITEQEHAEKLAIITEKYQIATGAAVDFAALATSSAKNLENSLMSLADGTTTVKDAFRSMARNIISELYRVMVVQQAVGAIMGAFGFTQSAKGGYIKTPSAEGGGYTGSGARSGGVDGRGGFHAILHPQETVVDHTKGQSIGTTVNQTINVSTGVQQTVRTEIVQLLPQIAETTKLAVLDARRRGGSFSAAFS